MRRASILNGRRLLTVFFIGVVAVATFGLLWARALAPDQARRVAGIARLDALAAAASAGRADQSPFPPNAVCAWQLAPAEALLRIRISDAAQVSGVEIVRLQLSPEPGAPLSSILLDARVEGPYASGLNFMKIVADQTPTLFVQNLKIDSSEPIKVGWDISARVYCAIRFEP